MTTQGDYLRKVLEYAVSLPYFVRGTWPDGSPKTKCNLFTKSILSWQGARYLIPEFKELDFLYDITPMNPGAYLWQIMQRTDTRTAYANVMRMAKSGLDTGMTHDKILPAQIQKYPVEIDEVRAHDYANQGIPVWVCSAKLAPVGHDAIICPDESPYDEARGNRITQAGWVNGFFYMYQIFGELWRKPDSDIKYFIFPKEEEIKNG
jgi:hypothetical protein